MGYQVIGATAITLLFYQVKSANRPRRDFALKAKSRGGTLVTRAYIKESTYSWNIQGAFHLEKKPGNYNCSRKWEYFDQSCVNRAETVHGTLRFLYLSHLLYGICVKILPYESVYFKGLHHEQGCYWPTIYRAGAAVVWTITSCKRSW